MGISGSGAAETVRGAVSARREPFAPERQAGPDSESTEEKRKERAMDKTCPFCLDRNVKPVGGVTRSPRKGKTRRLMECPDCEKWYWSGSRKEVPRLFEICATAIVDPLRCYEEIREAVNSGGTVSSRCRMREFNWLCGQCPHGRFMAGRISDLPAFSPAPYC